VTFEIARVLSILGLAVIFLVTERVVTSVGPLGPTAVMLSLLLLTFLATCFIPTAILVLLPAPIILNTSQQMAVSPMD
jgi:di/tricarboxylate transporter